MRVADTDRDDDAVNTEEKIWDLTHNINVKGVWYGCKHAIIAMRKVRLFYPDICAVLSRPRDILC